LSRLATPNRTRVHARSAHCARRSLFERDRLLAYISVRQALIYYDRHPGGGNYFARRPSGSGTTVTDVSCVATSSLRSLASPLERHLKRRSSFSRRELGAWMFSMQLRRRHCSYLPVHDPVGGIRPHCLDLGAILAGRPACRALDRRRYSRRRRSPLHYPDLADCLSYEVSPSEPRPQVALEVHHDPDEIASRTTRRRCVSRRIAIERTSIGVLFSGVVLVTTTEALRTIAGPRSCRPYLP